MNNTPNANRTHIGIFGETNAGKSSLFNSITNTNISIVSDKEGTTTDPVKKAMELLPFGPVVLIDTAGLNDNTELGKKRLEKTEETMQKIDYALYLADINNFNETEYKKLKEKFKKYNVAHTLIFTKIDIVDESYIEKVKTEYKKAVFVNNNNSKDIEFLKKYLSNELSKYTEKENSLLGGLIEKNKNVLLVAPQDSEAPKGRLILPQAQLIRDCLDNDINCTVCTLKTLKSTMSNMKNIDLVVTDSQVFKEVNEILADDIMLTSFSILYANQKSDVNTLKKGIDSIKNLKENDKILMAEVCTHSVSHEDIGRYKIPKMLQNKTGVNLQFDYVTGKDFAGNLNDYALIVHCGGCMITKKDMGNRVLKADEQNTPITNYGLIIAYCTGILDRSMEILS